MSSPAEMPVASEATEPRAAETVLRAEKVVRAFIDGGKNRRVLQGVDVTLRRGEVTALIGKSGSGKSTLLHLLGLLDRPDGGEIYIDGAPVSGLPEKRRAAIRNLAIGFIFQHYFLLPDFDVYENVLMAAKVGVTAGNWPARMAECKLKAEKLLDTVGLSDHRHSQTRTLSGGERQRVAVARALMLDPKILLCDEPTGNLDPETGGRIMDLIFELSRRQGMAVLVVTHDPSLSARADRLLRIENGVLRTEK